MNTCERLRPLLFKIVEGEGTPEEAFEVGQHLSDCTVCRIRMAREERSTGLPVEETGDVSSEKSVAT